MFPCPITMTVADPVEPGPATAALLRLVFGPELAYLEQGWLLYLTQDGAPALPEWSQDAYARTSPFMFAGPLDQVALRADFTEPTDVRATDVRARRAEQAEARVRLVADWRWRTLYILRRLVAVQGRPAAGRYVSLVADRFDERGWRVDRVAAMTCRADPFDGATSTAVELTPYEGLFRWGSLTRR